MQTEISRNYPFSDAVMFRDAKAVGGYLESDLDDFTAFDATINKQFLTDFNALLADANTDVSDNVIVDRQVQLTDEANNVLEECILVVDTIAYFVQKAFSSKAVRNEFGLNHLTEAKKSKSKMIPFLRDFSKVSQKYKTQLVAEGCKPETIDNTDVLHKKLDEASKQSKLYKGNRPVITQERIIKYNALWTKVMAISTAAKIVYRNNAAKQKRYLTPKQNSRTSSVKVAPNSKLAALVEGVDDNTVVEIKNTGHSALVFFVADKAETTIPDNALTVSPGETKTVKTEAISNGTYGQLIVANSNGSEGAFVAHILE